MMFREVNQLKLRVAELESQLEGLNNSEYTPSPRSETGAAAYTAASIIPSRVYRDFEPKSAIEATQPLSEIPSYKTNGIRSWEGMHIATTRSDQTSYYGPASSAYFVSRIGAYLAISLQQPVGVGAIQLDSASRSLPSIATPQDEISTTTKGDMAPGRVPERRFLSKAEEDYFLSLFWQSYHPNHNILDEGDFRRHYASLWTSGGTRRKPSPLVDIVIALCMQYGLGFLPRRNLNITQNGQQEDAQIAGKWYYRRCQSLLALEMESPTLMTVQCYFYTSAYLCFASFMNMSHATMATGIRTAQILGLHREPPEDLSLSEKELRRRVWSAIITQEALMSMKLGREPLGVQLQEKLCHQSDDHRRTSFLAGMPWCHGDISTLTYSAQMQQLASASLSVYRELYRRFDLVLWQRKVKSPYTDPGALEECAALLSSKIGLVQEWVSQVPTGMKVQRNSPSSLPFSTDRVGVVTESSAPTWLQRQRLLLELYYHTLCINLHRPFITFSSSPEVHCPNTESHATAAVKHAITLTNITHQILMESDLLNAWLEVFQWQWNATVTIVGFALACPLSPSTQAARKAIDKSREVFEMFQEGYAVAGSAARITTDLVGRVDALLGRFGTGLTGSLGQAGPAFESHAANLDSDLSMLEDGMTTTDDGEPGSHYYSEFLDSVLSVDAFNSFEDFYGDGFGFQSL